MITHTTGETLELPLFGDDLGDGENLQTADELRSLWQRDPLRMFQQWISSSDANGGQGFSKKSQLVYSSMWRKFVKTVGMDKAAMADVKTISTFTSGLSGRLRQAQLDTGRVPTSVKSVRRYLNLLSLLQKHLVRTGVRHHNAAAELLSELGQERKKPMPVTLSPQEEESLRQTVAKWPLQDWRDYRDCAILELLIGSGIKVSEVMELKVADLRLELDPPEVDVHAAKTPRKAPLAERSVKPVSDWLKLRRESSSLDDYLFPGDDQPQLSPSTIYRIVARAIKAANLNPVHSGPSVLRHTFATRQLRAGKPLDVVRDWLGHKEITSTMVYRGLVANPRGFEPA